MSGMKRWLLLFAAVFASLFVIQFATPEAKAAQDYSYYTYTIIGETSETIAPGVTHRTVYLRMDSDGQQMVAHGLIVETSNPNYKLEVRTNYKDNQCEEFGMQKLTEQLAAAQEKHPETDYNVIGGVNGDYYEMSNGRPLYTFMMDGTVINGAMDRKSPNYPNYPDYYPFFAVETGGQYHAWPVWQAPNWDT